MVAKPPEKRSPRRWIQRWEENIRMDLMKNYFYDVDRIKLHKRECRASVLGCILHQRYCCHMILADVECNIFSFH